MANWNPRSKFQKTGYNYSSLLRNYQTFPGVKNFFQSRLIYGKFGSPNFPVTRNIEHEEPAIESRIEIINLRLLPV